MSDCGSGPSNNADVAMLATAVHVHAAESAAKICDLAARIATLESWQTWATRLVLSLVITLVIGSVIAGTTIATLKG